MNGTGTAVERERKKERKSDRAISASNGRENAQRDPNREYELKRSMFITAHEQHEPRVIGRVETRQREHVFAVPLNAV